MTYENGVFTINPKLKDVGTYTVKITLTDDNDDPKKTKEEIIIEVVPPKEDSSNSDS